MRSANSAGLTLGNFGMFRLSEIEIRSSSIFWWMAVATDQDSYWCKDRGGEYIADEATEWPNSSSQLSGQDLKEVRERW